MLMVINPRVRERFGEMMTVQGRDVNSSVGPLSNGALPMSHGHTRLQNRFLAQIDILSDQAEALPDTKSAKNGLREDDEKVAALFS